MFVFINLVDFLSPWEPVGRSLGPLLGGLGDPNYYCFWLVWHPGSLPNFVLNLIFFFDGFWSGLGVLLGSLLGTQIGPRSVQDGSWDDIFPKT